MTDQNPIADDQNLRAPDLSSCLFVGIGSVLLVAFMAQHPTIGASDFAGAMDEAARKAATSRLVHGALIATLVLVFHGFVGFVGCLGWSRGWVRAGIIFNATGVLCMIGAALMNGFVVGELASRYAGHPGVEIETLRAIFGLCRDMNQTLSNAGTIALSVAVLSWSWVLFGRDSLARAICVSGLVVGAFPVAGILSGHLHLHMHGMLAVILAQALWGVCLAIWGIRIRSQAAGA